MFFICFTSSEIQYNGSQMAGFFLYEKCKYCGALFCYTLRDRNVCQRKFFIGNFLQKNKIWFLGISQGILSLYDRL